MAARIIEYKGRRKTEGTPESTESRVDKWEKPEDRRPKAEEAPDNRGSGMHLENRIYETILQNVQKCTYAKEKEDIKEVSLTKVRKAKVNVLPETNIEEESTRGN